MAIKESRLRGVYEERNARRTKLYTKNLVKGRRVYGEQLITKGRDEYREWNPTKSKLAAAILKGVSQIGLKPGKSVLYLGASTGTTVSHVSDIVTSTGCIFAVESSARMMRELVFLCEQRKNIAPILADANQPDSYAERCFPVDLVYQDIAQRNQVDIFIKNCMQFLNRGGFGLLAVKARSIDVSSKPRKIYKDVQHSLEQQPSLAIVDKRELEPFERDHCMFVCKRR